MDVISIEDYNQQDFMRDFLVKLGVIEPGFFDGEHLHDAFRYATCNFGTPTTLLVNPQTLEALKKLNNLKP